MNLETVIDRLKNNDSVKFINKAIKNEDRIRFFTLNWLDKEFLKQKNTYYSDFNTTIKNRYNSVDAYSTFTNHLNVPFPTLDFVKGLYSSVSKIFCADNPFINYVFSDKEKKADNLDFYKNECWEAYKDTPNAIVIIDTNNGVYERYILDIRFVKYVKSKENIIKEIIFSFDDKKYYAFDEDSLFVGETESKGDYESIKEVSNIPNTLEKTPAVWLSDKFIKGTNEIVRQSLISDSLSKIEELLITEVNDSIINEKLVPVTLKYIDKCTYDVGHEYCLDGWIMKRVEEANGDEIIINDVSKLDSNGKRVPCHICNRQLVPGDNISVEKPVDELERDLISNWINYAVPPKEIFEKSKERLTELREQIKSNVLGISELNTNLNHNEDTIRYTTESRETILNNVKSSFENLIKSVDFIYYSLKESSFKNLAINLGSDFFLRTVKDVMEEHTQAKELNLDRGVDYVSQFISAKFQNDPEQRAKSLLIVRLAESLRPYNDLKQSEIIDLFKSQTIEKKDFDLHINFYSLLNDFFELEPEFLEMEFKTLKDKFSNYLKSISDGQNS